MVRLLISLIAAASMLLTTAGGSASVKAGRVVVYPAPAGQPLSSDYVVKVRPVGGTWRDLDEYQVTVDLDTLSKAAMVVFDSSGPVQVMVRKTSGTIGSARVRPSSYSVKPVVSADHRTAVFTLPRPMNVSFETNGDTLHNLHVFANPVETDAPRPGPKVMYFGPGVHRIPGDHVLRIPSGTTVYLAGGAIVQGALLISHANHVVVRGHGILNPSAVFGFDADLASIVTDGATDVAFRDFIIVGAVNPGFNLANSKRIVMANVKEFSFYRFADGIDVQASSDILADDVFLRTSDDSIGVFASTPWGAHGDSRNITVRNSTLWADVAHPIVVGTLGDPNEHDSIDNVYFENLDILEHDEDNERYQGTMAVNAGDQVSVRNVQFQNIRVDDFTEGQLVNVEVYFNTDYNKKPGASISRVLFRNVSYRGHGDLPSHIQGYDATRQVTNVVFENLKRNGATVLDPRAGNIVIGSDTSDVVFRNEPSTTAMKGTARALRYSGSWAGGGGGRSTQTRGSAVTLRFEGRQARVFGSTTPSSGRLETSVDGKVVGTVDTYSEAPRSRQILFDSGVLASGSHTLTIRCAGAKNVLSTGVAVRIEKVEVVR